MMAKADFKFESNLSEAKSRLQTAQRAGLLAACLTVEKYVKEYSRYKTGGTRDSYGHELVEDGETLLGAIGSDEMNAIYEEYGENPVPYKNRAISVNIFQFMKNYWKVGRKHRDNY